jgi:hypothetical protein
MGKAAAGNPAAGSKQVMSGDSSLRAPPRPSTG